jgi:hypothetical protein
MMFPILVQLQILASISNHVFLCNFSALMEILNVESMSKVHKVTDSAEALLTVKAVQALV